MKSQVFQSGVFQNFLVDVDHRVRVVHLACFWGWEHPRIAGVFLVFCDQQIDCILRDGDFSNRVFCFRAGDVRFACVVASRQLFQRNIPDARRDVQFDAAPVILCGRKSQVWLCV